MSDTPQNPSAVPRVVVRRPSLFTIGFLFLLFAGALLTARYVYAPSTVLPQDASAENLSKELEWRATAESRRKELVQLNQMHIDQQTGYRWIDQGAGAVQLPIERAMELTVQKYNTKK